jgi:ABC-2 type transport system ATP-binding protein
MESGGDGTLLLLDDHTDDQSVLDAARAAGPVRHFETVHPTLTELFREVVQA